MRRSGSAKFPNSVQLFKFCQKVLVDQRGSRVHDQDVGAILEFNPSDCSHWKRGEKNVKSVFALARLATVLGIEVSLVHDLAMGATTLDEAYFEYIESKNFKKLATVLSETDQSVVARVSGNVNALVESLHNEAGFTTPPLYLPELLRLFPFVTASAADMLDRLSRILRVKPGQYTLHFKKGDLKPQTRMSMTKDLGRIIFEAERSRFSLLDDEQTDLIAAEVMMFTAQLLAPRALLIEEMAKLDSRRNIVADLANLFWVPKNLIGFQLQEILRSMPIDRQLPVTAPASTEIRGPFTGDRPGEVSEVGQRPRAAIGAKNVNDRAWR